MDEPKKFKPYSLIIKEPRRRFRCFSYLYNEWYNLKIVLRMLFTEILPYILAMLGAFYGTFELGKFFYNWNREFVMKLVLIFSVARAIGAFCVAILDSINVVELTHTTTPKTFYTNSILTIAVLSSVLSIIAATNFLKLEIVYSTPLLNNILPCAIVFMAVSIFRALGNVGFSCLFIVFTALTLIISLGSTSAPYNEFMSSMACVVGDDAQKQHNCMLDAHYISLSGVISIFLSLIFFVEFRSRNVQHTLNQVFMQILTTCTISGIVWLVLIFCPTVPSLIFATIAGTNPDLRPNETVKSIFLGLDPVMIFKGAFISLMLCCTTIFNPINPADSNSFFTKFFFDPLSLSVVVSLLTSFLGLYLNDVRIFSSLFIAAFVLEVSINCVQIYKGATSIVHTYPITKAIKVSVFVILVVVSVYTPSLIQLWKLTRHEDTPIGRISG